MAAEIIDGKAIARSVRAKLMEETAVLKRKGIVPGLAVILVGDDPASLSYVTGKEKACEEVGIRSIDNRLPEDTSEEDLLDILRNYNRDDLVHGILVQLPLPKALREEKILLTVDPEKDVDGFHPLNLGKMLLGRETFLPATPLGVVKILEAQRVETRGAYIVVVGRSPTVGRPLVNMLSSKSSNATVTLCHTGTKDLEQYTRKADILISAVGSPGLIKENMVKAGAVVIDVGVTRIADSSRKSGYRLVGDVDFEAVKNVASKITPVPGGVGPMTITMLLANTVKAAKIKAGLQ